MNSRRTFLALVFLAVALASLPAQAQNNQQPPVTPGDPRAVYVVVLNREKGAEPEFDKGGAKQLARWSNRVVVELPPAALAAMLKHGRVKYVQHLNNGPVKATAPSPERTSASFVPKALTGGGTLNWTTGDYHYDGSGNIDRVGADSSGNTRRFVYDEVDRLVEAGVEAPMAAPGTYTNYSRYTYDSFGNRLSEVTPTINATVVADRATNRITLPGTIVTYDGVGNMTQGGGLIYQYDPFNNLKEVDSWGGVQKMSIYNANNERIIFCGDGSSGPCRWTLRGTVNEVLREYESGPIGNGNSFWSYYLWVEDSVYRGGLLAGAQREAAEGGRLDFHLDHLGSPRLTTNAAGQQVTANEFAPFGRELTSIMQEAQLGYDRTETHRFTGHERDFVEGTGSDTVNFIDYMHARAYTPVFGRFLSVDPIVPSAAVKQPQRWNRYAYVSNNPIRNTDPTGKLLEARASPCTEDTAKCYTKLDAFQAIKDWVGKDAAKYLQLGKTGQVTLNGISAANFSKLGGAAAIVANLIRSTSSTAALSLSANVKDSNGQSTSAFTRPDAKGTLTEINPAMFPRIEGGAIQTMDTALAHDLGGHGLQDMWGVSPFNTAYGSMRQWVTLGANYGEAFAITMENVYRASQGMDIRDYYINPGDYSPP